MHNSKCKMHNYYTYTTLSSTPILSPYFRRTSEPTVLSRMAKNAEGVIIIAFPASQASSTNKLSHLQTQ